ncbi:telomere-binding alpha subunit central [Geosmithia morbida]|uniref:Protection of telomeres protein 1 n=1 Tax=Geosmithia morbida TaxID=1094350 RepID=A0A9P4YPU5_9HYPO|nr:telomere-binding alpha subunit central [Geosmithia morbida]KAF4119602.1 telomere-binding alpha subunit central [Geosmithia morbida]
MAPPPQHKAVPGRLPPGFVSLRDILDDKTGGIHGFAKTIGVVIDSRAPYKMPNGPDWKASLRITDKSLEESGDLPDSSVQCHFFLDEGDMPRVQCGDIIILDTFRMQLYKGEGVISLLTNKSSTYSIFAADKIPKPPQDASVAQAPSAPSRKRQNSKAELDYVAYLRHNIDQSLIPTKEKFATLQVQSLNVGNKYKELKDLVPGGFADLVVRLTRDPWNRGERTTIWVTDFTENPGFHNHTALGASAATHDGDTYGYTTGFHKAEQARKKVDERNTGPFGRRTMQVSCWEPHATAIRDGEIGKGTWVSMKNVQIKYGNNGAYLEGFLRQDRHGPSNKIGIFALDAKDPETMDDKLRNAIRRHRDYEMSKKSQIKEIEEAAWAGRKRKRQLGASAAAAAPKAESSALRRKMSRQAKQEAAAAVESANANATPAPAPSLRKPPIKLNPLIKCENQSFPASSVSDLLKHAVVEAEVGDHTIPLTLPFYNANHRVDVRVTDFRPHDLRNFTYRSKVSNFAALSDAGDSELDSDDQDNDPDGDMFTEGGWEWRFALELEDAAATATTPGAAKNNRFWAIVDNQAAQCLTNQDATDLTEDGQALETLRQTMFHLWGDLEEKKTAQQRLQGARNRDTRNDPPPDSDDEQQEKQKQPKESEKSSNLPFSCCVRQYGIKVREGDSAKADAGDGHRWMRVFGLYGTRVAI